MKRFWQAFDSDIKKGNWLLEFRKSSAVGRCRSFLITGEQLGQGTHPAVMWAGEKVGWNAREGRARPEGLHLALLQQDVQNTERWDQSRKTEQDGAVHMDISVGGAWGRGEQLSAGIPMVRGFQKGKKKKTAKEKTVRCKTLTEPDIWSDTESKRLHISSPSDMSACLLNQLLCR